MTGPIVKQALRSPAYAGEHTIWKFDISSFRSVVEMPKGARILTAQPQADRLMLWVLVDPNAEREKRVFRTYPTGGHITDPVDRLVYIATIQFEGFVYHVFEVHEMERMDP